MEKYVKDLEKKKHPQVKFIRNSIYLQSTTLRRLLYIIQFLFLIISKKNILFCHEYVLLEFVT